MTNFAQMMIANSLAASQAPAAQIAKAQAKVKGKAKVAKPKTIAASIIAGLQAGRAPKDVLAAVLKKHKSATTIACVYWYKSRINRGLIK